MRTWVKWHMRHEHRARAHNTLWILLMNDEHNMGQYSSLLTTPTWWMSLELLTTCRALHVTHGAINVCLSWLNKIRVINIPTRVLRNILFTLYIFMSIDKCVCVLIIQNSRNSISCHIINKSKKPYDLCYPWWFTHLCSILFPPCPVLVLLLASVTGVRREVTPRPRRSASTGYKAGLDLCSHSRVLISSDSGKK